jgi:two-component system chemotaxis response regulator CheY
MSRILLIDDDDDVRYLVGRMLNDAGYVDVQEATNGVRGLDSHRQQPCDLVITDTNMPGGDGLDMIRALRRNDPNVKIIVMSGARPEQLNLATAYGADRILRKPFGRDQLLTAVREVLDT